MKMNNKEVPQLAASTFICSLAFLTDSFKVKLTLWGKQLTASNLVHFSTLNSLGKVESKSLKEHAEIISNLHKQFDVQFKDFKALEPHFQLFSTPFAVEIDYVAEEMQMELVELQYIGIPEFYQFLSQERFPMLFSASARIMAMFGSTYICEQFLSSMKINKSVLRSRLTDEHLKATLRLVLSQDIKPNVDALVDAKRCHSPP
uniref:HAT C-terminal dimerisation domain-containing protein n=1 Tax=Gopherus agassizii TaxID=38772 RepID=A0A452J7Y7_9SAUR